MDAWTEEGARTHALPPFPRRVDSQLIICGLSDENFQMAPAGPVVTTPVAHYDTSASHAVFAVGS